MTARRRLFAGIDKLDEAEQQVAVARAELLGTVETIQARLAPSHLLEDAIDGIKTRSGILAESAGQVVRDRPVATAAGAAGVALLLARKPVARIVRRLFSRS